MRIKQTQMIAAAIFLSGAASLGRAQNKLRAHDVTIPGSSISGPGDAGVRAHTNTQIIQNFTGTPQVAGPPYTGYFYEDPASIACIYLYQLQPQVGGCNPNAASPNPGGGSRAIGIVDAYDNPNAYSDLQTFSAQFGVQAITPGSFSVVFAPAGTGAGTCSSAAASRPPVDPTGGWEIEESLDVQWAHAMAPGATLYLVEAQSNSNSDLFCAVTVAGNLVRAAGGGEVSMSWGEDEYPGEVLIDPLFTQPGVVYFSSTGDNPGVIYPSASPNVIAAGGTSLSRNPATGSFILENTWQSAGGGRSIYESRPSYQNNISNIVGNSRGTPDLSSDANPDTGVWVLDNFMPPTGCGTQCWYIVGGTSVASPTIAGIVNAANSFAASSQAELTRLYQDSQTGDFTDITVGSCGPYMGYFAVTGWDFCAGLGSPKFYTGK